jgi:ankyrin repeat protein
VASYARTTEVDRRVMDEIRRLTMAELVSAERGDRPSRGGPLDLVATLALGDWETAARLVRDNPELLGSGGALHLMAKRNDVPAVRWLLERGADPNARWAHWDAEVTPLHMAAWGGGEEVARLLLAAGADPSIRDSKHHGDALDWAEHFGRAEIRRLLPAP